MPGLFIGTVAERPLVPCGCTEWANSLVGSELLNLTPPWNYINVSAGSTTAAPTAQNGVVLSNGQQLLGTAANDFHFAWQLCTVREGVISLRAHAKKAHAAGTLDWILLFYNQPGLNAGAFFDLENGVLGSLVSADSATITSLDPSGGGGWYDCTVNLTVNEVLPGPFMSIGSSPANGIGSYAGSVTEGNFFTGMGLADTTGAIIPGYVPTVVYPRGLPEAPISDPIQN